MSKKKSTTNQSQSQNYANTNTYGQITPNDTKDIEAFRGWNPQLDPSIGYRAAQSKNQLRSSLINPLSGYYSANTRDAIQRGGERSIDQNAAQEMRAGQYDVNQQKAGQLGSLAALTAPRIVSTGSSGSSSGTGTATTVQSGDLMGQILGAAAGVGSAALM